LDDAADDIHHYDLPFAPRKRDFQSRLPEPGTYFADFLDCSEEFTRDLLATFTVCVYLSCSTVLSRVGNALYRQDDGSELQTSMSSSIKSLDGLLLPGSRFTSIA
jgi:hypothetical protein